MTAEIVLDQASKGIYTILLVAAPVMILALVIGLIVSIFQATTQIQEQTLAFVPKIVGVFIGLIFLGPWMLNQLVKFGTEILSNLPRFIG
ncbi:MAG TPA: flagellar biosynthesis protein FliQ [Firmicutes bacterium]|nr:flagellar biosynthesis protein FliQ [Bacillota bacterium]